MTTPMPDAARPGRGIDPRGPRFGATVSAVLLATTVVAGPGPLGTGLLALAALLFLVGTARGTQGSVQGWVFRRWVRPRLAAPLVLEDPAPPRFAQAVGLGVSTAGLALGLVTPVAITVAAGIALVAAFLNAAFGFCLGCELYLLVRRLRRA
ncbi:membrane protein [Actinotalea fermentans ATCC 43279 = JCM 9966 = DSM 3133]|nr:membrane protein [Actinotalea fermentans ATCC 43279 = JCM 9966 = DSM 3133]